MKYLFLDTNIYLHCKDYEQLKWSDIIPTTEDVTVVVPPITRAEIDKIKDKGTGKVNKKARDISQRFREVFIEDVQRGIPMIRCEAPKAKDYEEYNLDRDSQDNQFILSAVLFGRCTSNDVLVVARDTNLLITAKDQGLAYLYLPDEYCLKPELSEEEKKLQRIQKELDQYKNRSSKPLFLFENGESILKLKKPILQETESLIQEAIADEWADIPFRHDGKHSNNPLEIATSSFASMISAFQPLPEEITRYNNEVEEYHKEFEEFITLNGKRA